MKSLLFATLLAAACPAWAATEPMQTTCYTVGQVRYCAEHPVGKPPVLQGPRVSWRCSKSGGTIYCF